MLIKLYHKRYYIGKIISAYENKIDVMFVGSDWKGTEKWNVIEN